MNFVLNLESIIEIYIGHTQGAGEGVDPSQKMPTSETYVFGSGHAWRSTFINIYFVHIPRGALVNFRAYVYTVRGTVRL